MNYVFLKNGVWGYILFEKNTWTIRIIQTVSCCLCSKISKYHHADQQESSLALEGYWKDQITPI